MTRFGIAGVALSLFIAASCSGLSARQHTERSSPFVPVVSVAASPTAPTLSVVPAASVEPAVAVSASPALPARAASLILPVSTSGTVGPLLQGAPPCFADRYPCEVHDFSLLQEGPIEVTLTWDGPPRALMVQLYWKGEGLAHEDVAPRDGPSRIWFRRPRMEAAGYRLRVVSLQPQSTIPYTLRVHGHLTSGTEFAY